jgi:catechol 2,3-dioxygenase-like lactoylglutathione lyase family enzyme
VFDHVTIRVSDREASERFYETVLRTLGIERTYSGDDLAEWGDFSSPRGAP